MRFLQNVPLCPPVVQSIATMRPTKAETTESLARIGNQSASGTWRSERGNPVIGLMIPGAKIDERY